MIYDTAYQRCLFFFLKKKAKIAVAHVIDGLVEHVDRSGASTAGKDVVSSI